MVNVLYLVKILSLSLVVFQVWVNLLGESPILMTKVRMKMLYTNLIFVTNITNEASVWTNIERQIVYEEKKITNITLGLTRSQVPRLTWKWGGSGNLTAEYLPLLYSPQGWAWILLVFISRPLQLQSSWSWLHKSPDKCFRCCCIGQTDSINVFVIKT